jgi:hypothetical protein
MKNVMLHTENPEAAAEEIEKYNGHITQICTPYIIIARLPDNLDTDALLQSRITIPADIDEESKIFVEAWKQVIASQEVTVPIVKWGAPGYKHPKNASTQQELKAQAREFLSDTSSRLVGKVAVAVIIVSGPDPNLTFSDEEIDKINEQVVIGLQVLSTAELAANITFRYFNKTFKIAAKPHSGNCTSIEYCESVWRDPALALLGVGSGLAGVASFNKRLRKDYKTDWAFTAFFTKYPLSHFAYGGSGRTCMQYSNDGYGPDQIGRVFAHETCHVFGAANEYQDPIDPCSCEESGYYNVPNYNCDDCTISPYPKVDCLMKKNDLSNICFWTRSQLGWPFWRNKARSITGRFTGGPIVLVNYDSLMYLIYGAMGSDKINVVMSKDGIVWIGQPAIPDQFCSNAMSAVAWSGKIWLVYEDSDGSGQLWVTTYEGNSWSTAQQIENQQTGGPITLIVFQYSLYLIYGAVGSSDLVVSVSGDGYNWKYAHSIEGVSCKVAAAAVVWKNYAWLVYEDNDGSGQLWMTSSNNAYTFEKPQKIEGQRTGGPITLSVYNNRLYLIYGDNTADKIWVTTSIDGIHWVNTHSIPDQYCKNAASCLVFNSKLMLVYQDNDGSGQLWVSNMETNT